MTWGYADTRLTRSYAHTGLLHQWHHPSHGSSVVQDLDLLDLTVGSEDVAQLRLGHHLWLSNLGIDQLLPSRSLDDLGHNLYLGLGSWGSHLYWDLDCL